MNKVVFPKWRLEERFAQPPDQNRYDKPYSERGEQRVRAVPNRQQFPDYQCEPNESDASHGDAAGVQRGRLTTTNRFCYSGSSFSFSFMLFDQRGAGGEKHRKGKEQTSELGSIALRQDPRNHRDCSSKEKAQSVLGPLGHLQRAKVYLDAHRYLLQHQEPRADGAKQPHRESAN
jgi:hypothetical protein